MVNHEKDWKMLFHTGDCVDLQLRTLPGNNPLNGQVIAGDLRLLISMQEGQPVAVVYRPVAAGTHSADKPIVFASPVGRIAFESIEKIECADRRRPAQGRLLAGSRDSVESPGREAGHRVEVAGRPGGPLRGQRRALHDGARLLVEPCYRSGGRRSWRSPGCSPINGANWKCSSERSFTAAECSS